MNNDGTNESFDISELDPDHQAAYHLRAAYDAMKANKLNDRSPVDRHWAIALTELEKVVAYFDYWVCRYMPDDATPSSDGRAVTDEASE